MTFDVNDIVRIAQQAGDVILDFYHQKIDVEFKADESPITQADKAAHSIIDRQLRQLTPEINILSEEGEQYDWAERQTWTRFWLVDPLDGTKEFIKRNGEFTVNIALIEDGYPSISVVHAPVLRKTWLADGKTAWLETIQGREVIKTKNAKLPTIVCSRSHESPDLQSYLKQFPAYQILNVGSSLKFCLVAEGQAQCYPRLNPTMMWDTAAGQGIVESAGGSVLTDSTQRLNYYRDEIRNPAFFCGFEFNPDTSV